MDQEGTQRISNKLINHMLVINHQHLYQYYHKIITKHKVDNKLFKVCQLH
jgi:hypothetical protein